MAKRPLLPKQIVEDVVRDKYDDNPDARGIDILALVNKTYLYILLLLQR